jgi:YcxB-like protein
MESRDDVSLQYQLKPSDVYAPFQSNGGNLWRWVTAIVLCYIFYDRYKVSADNIRSFDGGDSILAIIVVLGIFILLALLLFPYLRIVAYFRKSASMRGLVRVDFRDEGIHFAHRHGVADVKWSLYTQAVESRSVFYLGSESYTATYVPKRCMTKSEVVALRKLIRANVLGKVRLRTD